MNVDDARGRAPPARGVPGGDVRLRGFADRASLDQAVSWIDRHAATLGAVIVPLPAAVGRVPCEPLAAAADHPPGDRAADDGYALRAVETVGASAYAPALLRLVDPADPADPLPGGAATMVAAGAALPRGADTVLGFDAAQPADRFLEVIAPVAQGTGVERAGQQLRRGDVLVPASRPLRAHDIALLAAAGIEHVSVVTEPRVLLVVAGAKGGPDAHAVMLRALLGRDGARVEEAGSGEAVHDVLGGGRARGADVVLVTGRSGSGPDDDAAPALAAAGQLAVHGVAVRPGGSSALGVVGRTPVVVLPGDPVACLCAYELLAGRLVRLLGGRDGGLPHPTCDAEVSRKIVSAVGSVDVCQVRLVAARVEPIGITESGGLASATRADGFVVVPAALEGYPPGSRVKVHLY